MSDLFITNTRDRPCTSPPVYKPPPLYKPIKNRLRKYISTVLCSDRVRFWFRWFRSFSILVPVVPVVSFRWFRSGGFVPVVSFRLFRVLVHAAKNNFLTKLLSFICEEIIVFYIFHHGGKYRTRALRRLTSNYRLTENQISSIF